jgi:hypothetical protein
MAHAEVIEQSAHTFNHDSILDAFADGDTGVIPDFAYEIQSSSDAFKYASSTEKRDRLLDEFLKRKDALFMAALACTLSKTLTMYILTRYTR